MRCFQRCAHLYVVVFITAMQRHCFNRIVNPEKMSKFAKIPQQIIHVYNRQTMTSSNIFE